MSFYSVEMSERISKLRSSEKSSEGVGCPVATGPHHFPPQTTSNLGDTMSSVLITPIPVQTIQFYNTEIQAVEIAGKIHLNLRRACESLGIDFSTQLQKLKQKDWATMVQNPTVGIGGVTRSTTLLSIDSLPMWLATLQPHRVKRDKREVLIKFQREAAHVLYAHFTGDKTTTAIAPIVAIEDMRAAYRDAMRDIVVPILNQLSDLKVGQRVQNDNIKFLHAMMHDALDEKEKRRKK